MSPSVSCSSSGVIFNVAEDSLEAPKLIIISHKFCKSRMYKLLAMFRKVIFLEALKDIINPKD